LKLHFKRFLISIGHYQMRKCREEVELEPSAV